MFTHLSFYTQLLPITLHTNEPTILVGGATLAVNTNGNGELMSIKRVPSNTSMSGLLGTSYGGIYTHVWKALVQLSIDPCPEVADTTKTLIDFVKQRVLFHSCSVLGLFDSLSHLYALNMFGRKTNFH